MNLMTITVHIGGDVFDTAVGHGDGAFAGWFGLDSVYLAGFDVIGYGSQSTFC